MPVEWDQVREQLAKLADSLQPTEPGGVSPLGRRSTPPPTTCGPGRQHPRRRHQTVASHFGAGRQEHHVFSTVKNLAILVSALQDSTDVMRQLNQNLASVTGLLADDPDEVANAVRDLNAVVGEVQTFVAENRESLGTTSDKLARGHPGAHRQPRRSQSSSCTSARNTLHENYVNIWQPAQGRGQQRPDDQQLLRPDLIPVRRQSRQPPARRRESAKLCVQYLAPSSSRTVTVQLPAGCAERVRRASTRPNELTYSEDWLRRITFRRKALGCRVVAGPGPGPAQVPTEGAPLPPSMGPLLPAEAISDHPTRPPACRA